MDAQKADSEASRVSVVIPLYNKRDTIRRAVESVLSGTVLPDEIIVVDDGSTDGSAEALSGVVSPAVRIVRQPNGGVSAARNRGIRESRGEWIAFLDADDEWLPEFLETILKLAAEFPGAGLYGTAYEVFDGSSTTRPALSGIPAHPWRGKLGNLFAIYQTNIPFNSDSVMLPRSVFDEVGLFMEGESFGEDVQMWLRVFLRRSVVFTTDVCTRYHTGLAGRAYGPGRPVHAAGYARWLEETALSVPPELRPSVLSLREHVELGRLSSLVGANQRKQARAVYRAFPFRVYRTRARLWAALSLLPRPAYRVLWLLWTRRRQSLRL